MDPSHWRVQLATKPWTSWLSGWFQALGAAGSRPLLAALLLVVGGMGATAAWVFAVWSGVVKKVENLSNPGEVAAQQVRIQELEEDVQRYRAAVDAQLGLLPAAGETSAQTNAD